jgi:hypothetical protein
VGVEVEVVPALWREEQGGRVAVGRGRLVQYGRQLVTERRVWSDENWGVGLELHVEVFDRMDGLQMLSARGRLVYEVTEEGECTVVQLEKVAAGDARGSSFSAASRDPEQRRFANIEAYFSQGDQLEYPCSLCARVTVRDQRTGRYGLLWEEGKGTGRRCMPRPNGSTLVASAPGAVVGPRGDDLLCSVWFNVRLESDQEGIPAAERLYYISMGEANSQGEFEFVIESTNVSQVGALIRSVC